MRAGTSHSVTLGSHRGMLMALVLAVCAAATHSLFQRLWMSICTHVITYLIQTQSSIINSCSLLIAQMKLNAKHAEKSWLSENIGAR